MTLRVERRDGTAERAVVTACVVSRAVLGPVAARWEPPGLMPSRWANTVVGWCVEHYRQYGRAPGGAVGAYFDQWAVGRDRETAELVETFLASLSEEHTRLKRDLSPDHVLDLAGRLFERARLADLKARLEAALETGDTAKARALVDGCRKIEIASDSAVDVLAGGEELNSAFDEVGEPLVVYPGALGNFFTHVLGRDQFIAFFGMEKVGKSRWLLDVSWRAAEQGRRVAHFAVGDMGRGQVLRRFAARACGRPVRPGKYEWPLSLDPPDGEPLARVKSEWREAKTPLTPDDGRAAFARLAGRVGPGRLKLVCHPAGGVSVAGIDAQLEAWDRDGEPVDVVTIDYADNLAPPDRRAEKWDQASDTWQALSALRSKHHCAVVTASQVKADAYNVRLLTREHFSGSHLKLAHATGVVGINQRPAEKDLGLYRLNWIVGRELEFGERTCCWVAGCAAADSPAVLSTF